MSCEFERQAGLWKATDVIMLQDGPLMSLEQSMHTTCWLEYGTRQRQRLTCGRRRTSSPPGATVFLRSPLMSQTRTVWSKEADTTRSSFGWKLADMT